MIASVEALRKQNLTEGLALDGCGLEISPLYRPTVTKDQHSIWYTDYTTSDDSRQKHAGYEHAEIVEIDFVWSPGTNLADCTPNKMLFDYAISSHVLEHVPDPIGWLLQVFNVLKPGAILSLAMPNKMGCFDRFRTKTEASDLVDAWIRQQAIPSPRQLYDFLSRSVKDDEATTGIKLTDMVNFETSPRAYSDKDALNYVIASWREGTYFDAHCSVFTPASFVDVLRQITQIGILNIEISEPVENANEFFVKLIKTGEPSVPHPGSPHPAAINLEIKASLVVAQRYLNLHFKNLLASRSPFIKRLKRLYHALRC